jgi:pimeloyl-ACP methyl ester carboxylesterase
VTPLLRLLYWLGPWMPDERTPQDVNRSAFTVPGARPFEAWLFQPAKRRPRGALLLVPGLSPAGPSDVRMERFARKLASAGFLVGAPFLPDFCALELKETVFADLARSLDALAAHPAMPREVKPGVFSISFGSLPALRLAADPRYAERLGGLVLFGGYADFESVVSFALGGEGRDPLNPPVVFMNLLHALEGALGDRAALIEAWRSFVLQTWGRPEMKARERFSEVAERLAAGLNVPEVRELFLLGCGLREGGLARCRAALASQVDAVAFLDPRPHLHGVRCEVSIFHGRDDDVIPFGQAALLERALPPQARARTYLTGVYSHTGKGPAQSLRESAGEVKVMLGMLGAMVRSATRER